MRDKDKAEPGRDPNSGPDWIDRHLGKILLAVAMLCAMGLIGRVLTA